jgi:hypothetical protein
MNFTQVHERLRLELLRRVQRGSLSVSLLSRQTGFGQPHLSNFLRGRRQLSLEGLDKVMAAQHMSAADLLPALAHAAALRVEGENERVPLVSHAAALFEPNIRPAAIQSMFHFPLNVLKTMRTRTSSSRRAWQRFVAVRIAAAEAPAMDPLVLPEAIALVDRHYNSLAPYRTSHPNLYAVRLGSQLRLRYVNLEMNRLVLRPLSIASAVELIDLDQWDSPGDLLAGRVALMLNEL